MRGSADSVADMPTPEQLRAAAAGVEEAVRPMEERRRRVQRDLALRAAHQLATDDGLAERMVLFWGNLFTVSAVGKPVVGVLAASFENDAIRPHVFGRFVDLLRAATLHPAMNLYLDGVRNVGPGSPAGRRRPVNINENHARELLELHTVGTAAGYAQDDVVAAAKLLTGWRIDRDRSGVVFDARLHEPGSKTILGRRFPEGGAGELDALLAYLATHPATVARLSARLAAHFVADVPPPALVDAMVRAWHDSDGHVGTVVAAMLDHPLGWAGPLAKMRTNEEWLIAALRLVSPEGPGAEGAAATLLRLQRLLGQPPFSATSPKGWGDAEADWLTPSNLVGRVDAAARIARRGRPADPRTLLASSAPWASPSTRDAIEGAPTLAEGVILVLASAEFQRR